MVEVRMKSLSAGPAGVRLPGSTHPVSAAEAKQLVDGGYAELVEGSPVEQAVVPPPDGVETATAPQVPPTRKKRG